MWVFLIGLGLGILGYLSYFFIKRFIEKKKQKNNDSEIIE